MLSHARVKPIETTTFLSSGIRIDSCPQPSACQFVFNSRIDACRCLEPDDSSSLLVEVLNFTILCRARRFEGPLLTQIYSFNEPALRTTKLKSSSSRQFCGTFFRNFSAFSRRNSTDYYIVNFDFRKSMLVISYHINFNLPRTVYQCTLSTREVNSSCQIASR